MKFKKDQKVTSPTALSKQSASCAPLPLDLDRNSIEDQRYQQQQQQLQQPQHSLPDNRQQNAFYSAETSTQRLFDDFR